MSQPDDYKTLIDRRLIPLALMVPAAVLIAVLAKALGLGHDGRVLLSALSLGSAACVGTIYALQLGAKPPGLNPDRVTVAEAESPHEEPEDARDLLAALEASLWAIRDDPTDTAANAFGQLAAELSRTHRDVMTEAVEAWHTAVSARPEYPPAGLPEHGPAPDLDRALREALRAAAAEDPPSGRTEPDVHQAVEPRPEHPPGVALSERELAIARLAASGLSNREISRNLVVTEDTVKRYMSTIYKKFGITSRQALAQVIRNSLDEYSREPPPD